MKLPPIPADKANHAIYGLILFLVLALLVGRHWALFLVIVAGCAWEARDWWLNERARGAGLEPSHDVSAYDVVGTVSLALLCWAVLPHVNS